MQEIRGEWILSLPEKVQIRARIPLVKKELPGELQIQNKIMWRLYKWGMLHVRRSLQLHPQKIVAGRKAVSNRFRFSVSQGWEKILVKATGTLALSNFDIYYTFYFLYIPINLFLCTCYINYSYEPLLLKLRYKQIIEKLIVTRIMKKHNLN